MGFLVWGEMANVYIYSETAIQRVATEWQAAVRRDYNHPSIIAWTPMNESWGVPNLTDDPRQAQHLVAMYAITKSIDQSRPVISNDGWEHAKTDMLTIHDYEGERDVLTPRYCHEDSILSRPTCQSSARFARFPLRRPADHADRVWWHRLQEGRAGRLGLHHRQRRRGFYRAVSSAVVESTYRIGDRFAASATPRSRMSSRKLTAC